MEVIKTITDSIKGLMDLLNLLGEPSTNKLLDAYANRINNLNNSSETVSKPESKTEVVKSKPIEVKEEVKKEENKPIAGIKETNYYTEYLSPQLLNRANITNQRIQPYWKLIEQESLKYGIQPELVASIITIESNGNHNAISPMNARGMMQLLPSTAREMGLELNRIHNPEDNIRTGIAYLDKIRRYLGYDKDAYKDREKLSYILASYNAGIGNVKRLSNKVFNIKETKDYVTNILNLSTQYRWR